MVQTCTLGLDVIRKAEKETMAYDRDLCVAKEAVGKRGMGMYGARSGIGGG